MHSSERLSPILLLGASGMLGRAWQRCLENQRIPFLAPSSRECDFRKVGQVKDYLQRHSCRAIVNCVGYTKVDDAETQQEAALELNAHAVGVLAEYCDQHDCLLVHYSTDYIFDGHSVFGYTETSNTTPCNFYGRSKLQGEQRILESGCRHLIIRTSWLYSHEGHNFVRTIANRLRIGAAVKVVDDQIGRPTHVDHLATTTLRLASMGQAGIYNITDSGHCSWHEFAVEIGRHIDKSAIITPCSSADFKTIAERPACSVLDLAKISSVCGEPPHWKVGLQAVMDRLDKLPPQPKGLAISTDQAHLSRPNITH